jgi:hypothetical protein
VGGTAKIRLRVAVSYSRGNAVRPLRTRPAMKRASQMRIFRIVLVLLTDATCEYLPLPVPPIMPSPRVGSFLSSGYSAGSRQRSLPIGLGCRGFSYKDLRAWENLWNTVAEVIRRSSRNLRHRFRIGVPAKYPANADKLFNVYFERVRGAGRDGGLD